MEGKKGTLNRGLVFRIILILIVIFLTYLFFSDPRIREFFHVRDTESLKNLIYRLKLQIEELGHLGPIIYLIFYSIGPVFFVPISPLPFAGGMVFGPVLGSILSLTGGMVSAYLGFLVARFVARSFIENLLKGKLSKLDDISYEHGFWAVLFIRFCGIPYSLQNFFLGLSSVKTRDYLLATMAGIAPWTIAITVMGNSLVSMDKYMILGAGFAMLPCACRVLIYRLYSSKCSSVKLAVTWCIVQLLLFRRQRRWLRLGLNRLTGTRQGMHCSQFWQCGRYVWLPLRRYPSSMS